MKLICNYFNGQSDGQTQLAINLPQQQGPGVGCQLAALEIGTDVSRFLP